MALARDRDVADAGEFGPLAAREVVLPRVVVVVLAVGAAKAMCARGRDGEERRAGEGASVPVHHYLPAAVDRDDARRRRTGDVHKRGSEHAHVEAVAVRDAGVTRAGRGHDLAPAVLDERPRGLAHLDCARSSERAGGRMDGNGGRECDRAKVGQGD